MPPEKNSSFTQLDLGPTGHIVAENVAKLRQEQGFSYNQLAKILKEDCKHEIPPIGLRRIEAKARKVTVDDLPALAMALGTNPAQLLTNEYPLPAVATGIPEAVDRVLLRDWMRGRLNSFDLDDLSSYYESEVNDNSFALKMKKHHLKQLERGKTEFPDLIDYEAHIPLVQNTIKRLQGWLEQSERDYKNTIEAIQREHPTPPADADDLRAVTDLLEKYNKLITFEDE